MNTTSAWDEAAVAAEIDRYWRLDPTGLESSHRRMLARLVRSCLRRPSDLMLEVGCGSGLVYRGLAAKPLGDMRYVGIDASREMLHLARSRFPSGRMATCSVRRGHRSTPPATTSGSTFDSSRSRIPPAACSR